MTVNEYSTDDGASWHELRSGIRVIFREVAESDDKVQELHLNVTNEGLIFDLVDQESGLVVKTGCKLATDIPEELVWPRQ